MLHDSDDIKWVPLARCENQVLVRVETRGEGVDGCCNHFIACPFKHKHALIAYFFHPLRNRKPRRKAVIERVAAQQQRESERGKITTQAIQTEQLPTCRQSLRAVHSAFTS